MKKNEVFIPDNFTLRNKHFTVEGHGGTVDILINSDPATRSENGLIGEISTTGDLIDRINEVISDLYDIKHDVEYCQYHEGSCWRTLKHTEAKSEKTEVA